SPTALVVNPAATRLYVVNNASNTVTVFPLSASGDVAGAGTNTATGGTCSLGVTVNAAGTRLYVAGGALAQGCPVVGTSNVTVVTLTASRDIARAGAGVRLPAGAARGPPGAPHP